MGNFLSSSSSLDFIEMKLFLLKQTMGGVAQMSLCRQGEVAEEVFQPVLRPAIL